MVAHGFDAGPWVGEVVSIGQAASVQFAGDAGFTFRVIRVDERLTYDGWCWLDGYQLDRNGKAVERRSIFVRRDGLPPARPGRAERRGMRFGNRKPPETGGQRPDR